MFVTFLTLFLLQSFQYQVLWHCHRVFWSQTFWPNLKIIKYCKISFYVSCIYAKPSYAWVFLTHFSLRAYKWASEFSEIARIWKQMSIDRGMDKEDVAHIYYGLFSSVQFSRSVVSDSLLLHESQPTRPPYPSQWWWISSQWCHPAISSSVIPSSSCPQSLHASGSFPVSQLFAWGGQSIGVSASVSVLPMNTQTDLLQDGLVGSPCSPRDSQESSPTPHFKSISFLVLSFLHSPALTSIHDHRENHNLDQTDLCWQSNVYGLLLCYKKGTKLSHLQRHGWN